MMKTQILILTVLVSTGLLFGQEDTDQLLELERMLAQKNQEFIKLENEWEALKLEVIQAKLLSVGYPRVEKPAGDLQTLKRDGYVAGFSVYHQQAQWVSHMILPDILSRCWERTDDFRPDPSLEAGPSLEDYKFKGKPFDKGHLAPAADFRWCREAVSASFLLSNMSPQPSDFNRGIWAELEKTIRAYITLNPKTELYLITGPVLKADLPKLHENNRISIPEAYYKVILDRKNQRGIAFLLDTQKVDEKRFAEKLEKSAMTISALEAKLGMDFFPRMDGNAKLENSYEPFYWLPSVSGITPLDPALLADGEINTAMLTKQKKGDTIRVRGTIVHTSLSSKGNITLYVDQKRPVVSGGKVANVIFTSLIQDRYFKNFGDWKKSLFNTDEIQSEQLEKLIGKQVLISGKLNIYKRQHRYKGKSIPYDLFSLNLKESNITFMN